MSYNREKGRQVARNSSALTMATQRQAVGDRYTHSTTTPSTSYANPGLYNTVTSPTVSMTPTEGPSTQSYDYLYLPMQSRQRQEIEASSPSHHHPPQRTEQLALLYHKKRQAAFIELLTTQSRNQKIEDAARKERVEIYRGLEEQSRGFSDEDSAMYLPSHRRPSYPKKLNAQAKSFSYSPSSMPLPLPSRAAPNN